MIEYRLARYDDYDHDAVVRVVHAAQPDEYLSVAELLDWERAQRRSGRIQSRWLAIDRGDIVGSGSFYQTPWYEDGALITNVVVHPGHQHRGHGRALLERVETSVRDAGARRLLAQADEPDNRSNRFLRRAGFVEVDRWWRSTLDLGRFDPDRWLPAIDSVLSQGIRFATVAELRDVRPGWERELHRLYVELEREVPSAHEIAEVPFEDFAARSLGRELLADGFLIALDGNGMIGLTEPKLVDEDPTAVSQDLTGVRSSYRRRGIALALKAAAATWAKGSGYTTIRTDNARSNAPMLAVNERLGFEPRLGIVEYAKSL